jgi:hypothetical protein
VKVDKAIKDCDKLKFELYMHSLQDSFVHKGKGHKVGAGNEVQSAWPKGEMSKSQMEDKRYQKIEVGTEIIYISPDLNNVAWHEAETVTKKNVNKWNKANKVEVETPADLPNRDLVSMNIMSNYLIKEPEFPKTSSICLSIEYGIQQEIVVIARSFAREEV